MEWNEELSASASNLNIRANNLNYILDNYDKLMIESFTYDAKDVGIRNATTRSRMKIDEEGDIELFSGDSTGLLINKKFKTTNLYGQAINQTASLIRMNTGPSGLMWNDWWVNPRIYQISDKLNPRFWTGKQGEPLAGPAYMDDLKISATTRWWCPGSPNLCGKEDTHDGHWVSNSLSLTPFFRAWDDIEYRKQLDELGIPT